MPQALKPLSLIHIERGEFSFPITSSVPENQNGGGDQTANGDLTRKSPFGDTENKEKGDYTLHNSKWTVCSLLN